MAYSRRTLPAAILLVVLAVTCLAMRLSERVYRLLGDAGINIVTRVMGLVLSAMAVLALLRDKRWKIPANIEYEYRGQDAVEEVRRCVDYCRKALEERG